MAEIVSINYENYCQIYTDGSVSNKKSGCAFICENNSFTFRLNDSVSTYTTEAYAILKALEYIQTSNYVKFLILTDSINVLHSLKNTFSDNQMVTKILELTHKLHSLGKVIAFMWIPSHIGINGNEQVDLLAKTATIKPFIDELKMPLEDLQNVIKQKLRAEWEGVWKNLNTTNKLRNIRDTTYNNHEQAPINLSRREEICITRLRIGHTRTTHEHLLKQQPPPMCEVCNVVVTIVHIVKDCVKYNGERQLCNLADNLNNLFNFKNLQKLLHFVKLTRIAV
jgi:ribonuclease HI